MKTRMMPETMLRTLRFCSPSNGTMTVTGRENRAPSVNTDGETTAATSFLGLPPQGTNPNARLFNFGSTAGQLVAGEGGSDEGEQREHDDLQGSVWKVTHGACAAIAVGIRPG